MAKKPSYAERAARDRLAVKVSQTYENAKQDSTLNRKVKELSHGDFRQEVQPQFAEVAFKGGYNTQVAKPSKVIGQLTGKRQGMGMQYNQATGGMSGAGGNGFTFTDKEDRRMGTTGSRTSISPAREWTTEGWRDKGSTPADTKNFKFEVAFQKGGQLKQAMLQKYSQDERKERELGGQKAYDWKTVQQGSQVTGDAARYQAETLSSIGVDPTKIPPPGVVIPPPKKEQGRLAKRMTKSATAAKAKTSADFRRPTLQLSFPGALDG